MPLFIKKRHFSSFQVIIYSFSAIILSGALLLCLPISSQSGVWTNFLDALFTSTSAVCVTGLVVKDTATYWSLFGQFIILLLIQIGGLGYVMVASMIAIASGKKISLMMRSRIVDAINAPQIGGIVKFTRFIMISIFSLEGIGAIVLSFRFIPEFGFFKGLWYGIFHSVSAMCNAGFDLMGFRESFSSLVHYVGDPLVSITIALLIVVGGLGFLTWRDIFQHRLRVRKYSLQSKIVLVVTGLLIVIPAVYFFFFEYNTSSLPFSTKLLASFFQSVTPRTAGFNTTDLTKFSEVGIMILIVLMLIGGSPGSTAGGMKTTTFAVLFFSTKSIFLRHDKPIAFRRSLPSDTIPNALTVLNMYLVLFLVGGCVISKIEDLPLLTCLFETASAIGTVGLTLGITPILHPISHMILILLMFIGRVGGVTLIYSVFNDLRQVHSHYVQEKVITG